MLMQLIQKCTSVITYIVTLRVIAFLLSFYLVPVSALVFSPLEIRDEAGVIWYSSPGQSTLQGAMISQEHSGQKNNITHGQQAISNWAASQRHQTIYYAQQRARLVNQMQLLVQQRHDIAHSMTVALAAIAGTAKSCGAETSPPQRLQHLTELVTTRLVPPFDIPLHALQHKMAQLMLDNKGVMQASDSKQIAHAINQFIAATAKDLPPKMQQELSRLGYDLQTAYPSRYSSNCAYAPLDCLITAHHNTANKELQELVDAVRAGDKKQATRLREKHAKNKYAVQLYDDACIEYQRCWPNSPVIAPSLHDPNYVHPSQLHALITQPNSPPHIAPRSAAAQKTLDNPRLKSTQHYEFSSRAANVMSGAQCGIQHLQGNREGQPIQHQLWSEAIQAADALGVAYDMARCCSQLQDVVYSTAQLIEDSWQATENKLVSTAALLLDHVGACNAYSMAVVRGVTGGVGDIVHMACHPVDTVAMLLTTTAVAQIGRVGINALYLLECDRPDLAVAVISQAVGEIDVSIRAWINDVQRMPADQLLEQSVRFCTRTAIVGSINTKLHNATKSTLRDPIRARIALPTVPKIAPAKVDIEAMQYRAGGKIARDVVHNITQQRRIPGLSEAVALRTYPISKPSLPKPRIAPHCPNATILEPHEFKQLKTLDLKKDEKLLLILRYNDFAQAVIKFRDPWPPLLPGMPHTTVNWEHIVGIEVGKFPNGIGWSGCHYGFSEWEKEGILQKVWTEKGEQVKFIHTERPKPKTFFPDDWSYEELMQNIKQGYLDFLFSNKTPEFIDNNYEFLAKIGDIESKFCISKKGELITLYPVIKKARKC